MRLSKVLAANGLGSRRKIDAMIEQGLITINQKTASLGQQYQTGDQICINSKPIRIDEPGKSPHKETILALHKPINTLCSHSDPQNRSLIYDLIEEESSRPWISVGRLDYKTSGLILLTQNGELANRLMHPSYQIRRVYQVKVKPFVQTKHIEKILSGIRLDDGIAHVSECRIMHTTSSCSWVSLSLHEGRNREVRRIFEALNLQVIKLKRVLYGNIALDTIDTPGQYRFLEESEIKRLLQKS